MWKSLVFTLLIAGTLQSCINREVEVQHNELHCKNADGAFLTKVDYRIESFSHGVILGESSLCIKPGCCNKEVTQRKLGIARPDPNSSFNADDMTELGGTLKERLPGGTTVNFSCTDDNLGIIETIARCEEFKMDGSGWNLVSAKETDTLCQLCEEGSFLEDAICKPCPRGRYTDQKGERECLFCPAGHTTYRNNPSVCVGPQLDMAPSFGGDPTFEAKVGYETFGSRGSLSGFWRSYGDWKMWKSTSDDPFAKILQKMTTSFSRKPRAIPKRGVTAVEPTIENVFCYTGDGSDYIGYANKTASGKDCTGPTHHCKRANGQPVCYCMNRDHEDTQPFCKTAEGTQEGCGVPKCKDQTPHDDSIIPCNYQKHTDVSDSPFQSSAGLEFSHLMSARKICDKLGGECKGVWGKATSWRLTELSVSQASLGSGGFEYHEKSSDCINPYHEYYFEQEW